MRGTPAERDASALSRDSRAFLAVGSALCVVVALVGEPVRGWLLVALVTATAAAGVVAVRRNPEPANPARFLTAGAILLVPAYALWYPVHLQFDIEFGSPAVTDWLFLTAYAALLIALAQRIKLRSSSDRRVEVLDSLIISVGLGVLVWVAFIGPYLQDETLSWPARLVAVSYTVVDLLLLGAVIRMGVQRGFGSRGSKLLASWVLAQLAADLLYSVTSLQGTFQLSGPAPVMYCFSFVLLGSALLDPSTMGIPPDRSVEAPVAGLRRFVVVVPAVLTAPAVLIVLGVREGSQEVAIVAALAGMLFGLVLVRVWHLMVDAEEHRRIRSQLTTSVEQERARTEENRRLVAELRERQMLSDRLSRIQRKISTRAPLQEVLDAITQGAAELLHDDVAALRLVDEHDPGTMVMVASVGVDAATVTDLHRLPVGEGVGGRAIVDNRLCIQDSYTRWDAAIPAFVTKGLQTAMAAPVHLGTEPIGSLVVATHRPDRHYSTAEQDALISFTEHVSIALNDARSVRTMNEALELAVHQAMHDELTSLPNRACFYDRTEQALRTGRRERTSTAVLLFDLDRFKEINDTLGHRYGDRVLRAIGPRIAPLLRETDTLARLGGDEFCVLLPNVDGIDAAMEVADRITLALEEPLALDEMTLVVAASCGVAIGPAQGDSADLLLQRADVAMYLAKTSHVSVVAYADHLDRNTPDRLALVGELRSAVASDELVVHYQPQVDLATGTACGAEALVRWDNPRRGLIGPESFIPIAEDTGLIHGITSWVLDAALRQLRRWLDDGDVADDFVIAVNLSTQSLLDERFVVEVLDALSRHDVSAGCLVLEITETTLMADPSRAARVLSDLSACGVGFAIDDFGTGYSSLASLKGLPVQHLKIDKSFVCNMHEDRDDAKIVRSVIDLGHTLGLQTIAEGVEHPLVWSQLVDLGCDIVQGYLIARPMEPDLLVSWLRRTRLGARPAADVGVTAP